MAEHSYFPGQSRFVLSSNKPVACGRLRWKRWLPRPAERTGSAIDASAELVGSRKDGVLAEINRSSEAAAAWIRLRPRLSHCLSESACFRPSCASSFLIRAGRLSTLCRLLCQVRLRELERLLFHCRVYKECHWASYEHLLTFAPQSFPNPRGWPIAFPWSLCG